MTEELPIACSLTASQLPQRLAEIAALSRDSFLADGPDGLRFRGDETTRARLEALVAAEAECCSFLSFDIRRGEGELVLSIAAPLDAQSVADALSDAFAGRPLPG
jgi:hypothetical protein